MHFLLERKTHSTWRLGLPKRIVYHHFMNVTDRLQFKTVSANSFGVHKAPDMEGYTYGYSLLIRDPIPRSLSEYFYRRVFEPLAPNRVQDGETLLYHSQVHGNYALKRLRLMDDCMHITDVWEHFTCVTHRTDSELSWGIEMMKRNLKRWFAVVGVLERFEEYLVLNHFAFNEPWDPCVLEVNVHTDLYSGVNLTTWQSKLMHEYNKYDVMLYHAVKELFDEEVRVGMRNPTIAPLLVLAQQHKLPICRRADNDTGPPGPPRVPRGPRAARRARRAASAVPEWIPPAAGNHTPNANSVPPMP